MTCERSKSVHLRDMLIKKHATITVNKLQKAISAMRCNLWLKSAPNCGLARGHTKADG